jgi:transposase, IS5 family
LFYDSLRKAVELSTAKAKCYDIAGWRQSASMLKKSKIQLLTLQRMRRSTSKDEKKQAQKDLARKMKCKEFLDHGMSLIAKVSQLVTYLNDNNILGLYDSTEQIESYIEYTRLFNDQVRRRVLNGEKIPSSEKVFSVFEPHTEWVVKGKAGVKQELGLKVCVVTDQYGFTLTHKVMEKTSDAEVCVEMVKSAKEKFPLIYSCSFDKGFWSKENKTYLEQILDAVAIRKKGRPSAAEKEHYNSEEFQKADKGHSAVEAAISAYDNHGLDKCPDKTLPGFKRYVALGVLARNLQHLGAVIIKNEKRARKRSRAIKLALKNSRQ